MSKITIKPAQKNDWQIIQKLNNHVFINDQPNIDDLDMEWPFSKRGISYYKKVVNVKYGKCFIAYSDDIAIGYIVLVEKDIWYRKDKYIEIENMGVDPHFRNHGIGKKLIKIATSWAKTKNTNKLFVAAYWNNKKALNFYKQNGFYETGVELEKKLNNML